MRNDGIVLVAVLKCSVGDLCILEDMGEDLYDVVETLFERRKRPTLDAIVKEVFRRGAEAMQEIISCRIRELEGTGKETEELQALRTLNPLKDIKRTGGVDPAKLRVWFANNGETYQKYVQQGIKEFDRRTGYTPT